MESTETSSSILHKSIDLVERCVKCILKYSKDVNEISDLNEIASNIVDFSNDLESDQAEEKVFDEFDSKIKPSSVKIDENTILKEFDRIINSPSEETDEDSVLDEFEERILKEFDERIDIADNLISPEQCERYVNLVKLMSERNTKNDEEITAVTENINSIDPISKLPIVEPVKNKNCGHVYEKSTIFQFIERNPKTKCPIAGCSVTEFVKKCDLIPDNALKRILSNDSEKNNQKKARITE